MTKVNLNSVRVFDAAARHLNFRLAAEELNLTQGAVAQQVRKLESELQLQLFYRQARGLAFTDTGRNYFKAVHKALTSIDEATELLRPEASRVTLSVTPSFASKWLVPRLALFAEEHPTINLQTIATEQLANFTHDGVDLAIRQGQPQAGAGLNVELLVEGALIAVCAARIAKAIGNISTFDDFAERPLIQDGHNSWEICLKAVGVRRLPRMIRFNRTGLAIEAAVSGQGIALVPHILAEEDIRGGRLVELWRLPHSNESSFYIIGRKDKKKGSPVDTVNNWITSQIKLPDPSLV